MIFEIAIVEAEDKIFKNSDGHKNHKLNNLQAMPETEDGGRNDVLTLIESNLQMKTSTPPERFTLELWSATTETH